MLRLPHQRKARIQLLLIAGFLIAFTLGVKTVADYLDWTAQSVDLRDAIVRGDLAEVKRFERDGIDWRDLSKPDEGYGALHRAIRNGHMELVRFFVENGADVTAEAAGGVTPAGVAMNFRNLEILKYLLLETSGGKAIAQNDKSIRNLDEIADYELVQFLSQHANLNDFVVPHEHAFLLEAARRQDLEMLKSLLAITPPNFPHEELRVFELYRLSVYAQIPDNGSQRGFTPLHWAAIHGNLDITKLLLSHGADPSLADSDGKTPLDHAKENESVQIVELIEAATKPDPDESELSPAQSPK